MRHVWILMALALTSCAKIIGDDFEVASGGGSGEGEGEGEGEVEPSEQACTACLYDDCKTYTEACDNDTGCYPLINCTQPCSDDGCLTTCAQTYPDSVANAINFQCCLGLRCAGECAVTVTDDLKANCAGRLQE